MACFLSQSHCQWNTARADLLENSAKMEGQKHAQEVLGKEEQQTMLAFEGVLAFQGESTYKLAGSHGGFSFLGAKAPSSQSRTLEVLLLFCILTIWYCIPFLFWSSSQKVFVHPGMLTVGKDPWRTCVWAMPALRRWRGPCYKQGWLPLAQLPVSLPSYQQVSPAEFTRQVRRLS